MGLFDRCLLASDVDGTLVYGERIPERNIEAIKYFVSQGGAFSLCTGRTVRAVDGLLERLGSISPCIMTNGAIIYDYNAEKILYERKIPNEDKRIAFEIYDLSPTTGIQIHSGSQVYLLRRNGETEDHDNYEGFKGIDVTKEQAKKLDWSQVVFLTDGEKTLEYLNSYVADIKCGCYFVNTTTTINGRKRLYLQQNPNGVSKAQALDELCKMLDIKKGRLFAAGDYYNDLPMLEKADISAAPENSPQDIKEKVTTVVCHAKNGAVADFIDSLIKIRKEAKDGR